MDKAVQAAAQPLRGRMYQRDNAKPKEHKILVLKSGVAGVQFHIKNEEERAALDALTPGTELLLFRDAENKYDEWAISVHLTEDDMIGYITRFKNETIARLMDAGKKFVAEIDASEVEEGDVDLERHRKKAPTENMSIPFSVYLVEEG